MAHGRPRLECRRDVSNAISIFKSRATVSPAIAEHVDIVLVDGLRMDESRRMNFLNTLRSRGADASCLVGIPSLSLPGRAVMMTGAWQEINGQLTNFNAHRVAVETLFEAAKKRNLTTALAASRNVQKMFAPFVDEKIVLEAGAHDSAKDVAREENRLRETAQKTRELLAARHPNLFVMDYTMTDRMGHAFGGASPEYDHAAQVTDEEIQKLANLIDFSNSVLVVTSDHGHINRGGHGGNELEVLNVPLVFAGKGIQTGATLLARQIDLAPTVAALLGIEIPAASQGRILFDALQVDDPWRRALFQELFQQKKNFNQQYLSFVRGVRTRSVIEEPASLELETMEETIDRLDLEAVKAKHDRIAMEPRARMRWVLPMILLPIVFLIVYLHFRWIEPADFQWGLFAVLIYWLVYFALFTLAGMGYSLSRVNQEENLKFYFGKDMLFAVAGMFASIAAMAGFRKRRPRWTRWKGHASESGTSTESEALLRSCYFAVALIAFSLLVKVALEYSRFGLFVRRYVPNMHWGFGEYLDLLQLMILGFTAWLAPLAGWVGLRLVPNR